MRDFPNSLGNFQRRYPDEAACAAWLFTARWPAGFRCPACAHEKGWPHGGKPFTFECAACGKQTSVTAGTIMHGSKLPLTAWSLGGLSSWPSIPTAFRPCNSATSSASAPRSRRGSWAPNFAGAMVDAGPLAAGRSRRVDERKSPCAPRMIRSPVVAAQPPGQNARRRCGRKSQTARPAAFVSPRSRTSPPLAHGFIAANVAPEHHDPHRRLVRAIPARRMSPTIHHVIGPIAAHVVLPWTHRVFSNLKSWALGVYHGLRKKRLQAYLDEFVFRFNRRRTRDAALPRAPRHRRCYQIRHLQQCSSSRTQGDKPSNDNDVDASTLAHRRWLEDHSVIAQHR